MDQLIKLVKTYRVSSGVAERLRLAEEIICLIRPDLHLFVFKAIPTTAADDVVQEILKSITGGLNKFRGGSDKEFWAWCYRIARHRLSDHFRKETNDRLQPTPPEELWQFVDTSAPLSAADKHDLEYAMKLLTASKPECRDYLWQFYVFGLDYTEIGDKQDMGYDAVRMRVGRCLDEAKSLVS
jgi:RNA polymerase sigma factor (sigma-70 family)